MGSRSELARKAEDMVLFEHIAAIVVALLWVALIYSYL
jgi:hypothetical protein